MKRKAIWVLVLGCVLFLLWGCQPTENNQKPTVGVSIVPQKTLIEAVAGEAVDVVVMIPPGASPANHEPAFQDVQALFDASVYFTIGVNTEKENILPMLEEVEGLDIVRLEEQVQKQFDDRYFSSGGRDPHIWLSPKRMMVMLEVVADHLCEMLPEKEILFRENQDGYESSLQALDKRLTHILQDVQGQSFLVFHPAFGYLADDYGLEMLSLEEDGKPASGQRLKEMTDLAQRQDLKVVFYQEEINSKQASSFAQAIGGRTMKLSPLDEDYLQNMQTMAEKLHEVTKVE